jgi:hypothetical protein
MIPILDETIVVDFVVSSSTGAAADADSTPTCEVFEDANDTAILSPTVTGRTGKTGNYRISIACTTANGFEAGKSYNAVVSATVGGIAAKWVAKSLVLRTYSTDSALRPATAGRTAVVDSNGAVLSAGMLAGVVVSGSTAVILTVSGLPSTSDYEGQYLYHAVSAEKRLIKTATYSGGNHTLTLNATNTTSGDNTTGPFSTAPTAGDLIYPC